MTEQPSLIISKEDFEKISAALPGGGEVTELLEEELARARVIPEDELPDDVVAMNTHVTFVDLNSAREQTVVLVFPHEANINEGKISIFAPVGAALIGLRVGQVIDWPMGERGSKRIRVQSVRRGSAV